MAVNKASIHATLEPLLVLMGSERSSVPAAIRTKKLSRIMCVVDRENRVFVFIEFPLCFDFEIGYKVIIAEKNGFVNVGG